jgi:hypothetical protein
VVILPLAELLDLLQWCVGVSLQHVAQQLGAKRSPVIIVHEMNDDLDPSLPVALTPELVVTVGGDLSRTS